MNSNLLMEIRNLKGQTILKFSYNPSSVNYSIQNQFYSILFLQSNRNVQDFLRSGKVVISGEGLFMSNPEYQNQGTVGLVSENTAIGQWKNFLDVFKVEQDRSPYFILYNPVLADQRTVVFNQLSIVGEKEGHFLRFSFSAVETDVIDKEERIGRFTAYNTNNAKHLTPSRVKEIETNIDAYIASGYSYDDALAWALKGKIPGSSEYQVVEEYVKYLETRNEDEDAPNNYWYAIDNILKENARLLDLAEEETNVLESINGTSDSNGNAYSDYVIKSGDTLSGLALRFYGSASKDNWMSIYNDNKDVIEDAARERGKKSSNQGWWIYPGTKIKIASSVADKPTEIVKREYYSPEIANEANKKEDQTAEEIFYKDLNGEDFIVGDFVRYKDMFGKLVTFARDEWESATRSREAVENGDSENPYSKNIQTDTSYS